MTTSSEFITRLREFVQKEATAQAEALERQWAYPLHERVAHGWAIDGLEITRIQNDFIRLRCETNESRFREGDLLVLHQGDPHDPAALHVDLQYDDETDLEAALISNESIMEAYRNPRGWIADQDWFDSSLFYMSALDAAADSLRGRSIVLPLLQGILTPKTDYARYEYAQIQGIEFGLNDTQMEAVAQAYAADLLHLIQGPPGTGKTWVLAQLARLLVADGKRVLVTALTHRAIHNALNKIPQVDADIPVCKIGSDRQIGDLSVPNYGTFADSRFGDLTDGYVVGATPFALYSHRLKHVEFDVVLFDEASQITLPLAIMGMMAGDKYVFIGDQNQLPPVSLLSNEQTAQMSIFAYLAGRGNETMLNITYRLNDALSRWPSRTFYRGELQPSETAALRRLKLNGCHTPWDTVLDPAAPVVFLDLCHENTTVRSRSEADATVELIMALLAHDISPEEIGVVTPYRAQSRLIRSRLRRAIEDHQQTEKIVVDTVERMQGQEREVVIISFATASAAFAAKVSDFLFQPQRLNVAVTRPRTKLILIGSHHMLAAESAGPGVSESIALLRGLLDECLYLSLPDGLVM
ncbi:MAG TPA: AAA domain-containing protein [Anaerolineaceae bacterium]|nr:AAA domain-containing protein [Anaerolineaceae bacterium]